MIIGSIIAIVAVVLIVGEALHRFCGLDWLP